MIDVKAATFLLFFFVCFACFFSFLRAVLGRGGKQEIPPSRRLQGSDDLRQTGARARVITTSSCSDTGDSPSKARPSDPETVGASSALGRPANPGDVQDGVDPF